MIENRAGSEAIRLQFDRVQRGALLISGAGLILTLLGAWLDLDQLFQSYLFAYLFWLGITLGSLAWLLIYHITGGRWGAAIRPLLEASVYLIGWMALLFMPLLLGLDRLYLWAQPEVVAHDAVLQHKQAYLNAPFFIGRALLYFGVWGGSIVVLSRYRLPSPQSVDPLLAARMRRFSGPALALYGLTVTFGAIDWLMSLDPYWFSTVFGILVAAGQVVTALAFAIGVTAWLALAAPSVYAVVANRLPDLGNLLLATVIFWAYIAFVQYFIIWSGNLPEEALWYLHRLEGGWEWVALALLLFHFAVPFALLLSGRIKRNARSLASVAALVLIMDLVHLLWLVAPTFSAGAFSLHWLDLVLPIFLGALWLVLFVLRLRRQPFVLTPEGAGHEEERFE